MVQRTHKRPPNWKYEPEGLEGKAVIVTGGTTGIGRATALLLASRGAHVLIFGRHEAELRDAMAEIRDAGKVVGLTADQTREEEVQRVFELADAQLGGVDFLINNAGVPAESIEVGGYRGWEYVVKANLLGYMICARYAIERMKARGGGHIVNIGSLSADDRGKGNDVYVATKAAVQAWSESLSKEVAEAGIRVSLVEPGLVGTSFPTAHPPNQEVYVQEQKMLTAEDIAEAILYCLVQPLRCDVTVLKLRPHREAV
ncbi:MAG: SDR family oxidoreductase [Candidatus Hydrogenedentes bacterium]|nr:SDR family oxidoreductase [Candidatus Hydrogenedentota bacterium]MBI3118638.1 SDR family oxidoreductase [Candidatus Hydrogenedentota bacterium]